MTFTSPIFLFYFLPLALFLFRKSTLGSTSPQFGVNARYVIFLLTLLFYGALQPWWLLPFLFCIGADFLWARLLEQTESPRLRKVICASSVIQNVGLLAFFKYGFTSLPLPPGISFYAFESMSFVIDVYRRHVSPPKTPHEFFAFIGMFPRFVAGPIVRYRQMIGQMNQYRGMELESGLTLFCLGLFLKGGFADSFSVFVPYAFRKVEAINMATAWTGVIAYTMQIYFDFSGYSLMAIGLGRALGFQFPTNFNRPYSAVSLQDFWRRWHISLSEWLRDYLYIALGGSQHGPLRTYFNLFITMLLGGAWHGAGITFLLWGAWHGVGLVCERMLKLKIFLPGAIYRPLTFLFISMGWIFFKADDVEQSVFLFRHLFCFDSKFYLINTEAFHIHPVSAVLCLIGILYCFFIEPRSDAREFENLRSYSWGTRVFCLLLGAVGVILLLSEWSVPFLYFQF